MADMCERCGPVIVKGSFLLNMISIEALIKGLSYLSQPTILFLHLTYPTIISLDLFGVISDLS